MLDTSVNLVFEVMLVVTGSFSLFLFLSLSFLKTGWGYVAQAGLDSAIFLPQPLSAKIMGVDYHARLSIFL